jgi:predicted proteasome-type protease
MKLRTSAFNAQGSRVIIVIIQVGAVKIYVAVVKALRKKERQDKTQFTIEIGVKFSLGPSYFFL